MNTEINEIKAWLENNTKADQNQLQKDGKNIPLMNPEHIKYLISEKQNLRTAYDYAKFNETLAKQRLKTFQENMNKIDSLMK